MAKLSPLSWSLIIVATAMPALAEDTTGQTKSVGQPAGVIAVHRLESQYQQGTTEIRVLMPKPADREKRYPAVYVLPVEPKNQSRYGDGLEEIRRLDLHNKHQAIFAAPTFSALPWYADHPDDPTIRQETYMMKQVIPLVEARYPAIAEAKGRLLLGFSKSGWGAWSLLLRNPDTFARAAAWDAPMMMQEVGKYGNGPIFGTQENFDRYRIDLLLRANAKHLGGHPRLILTGYGNFREPHQRIHGLMNEMRIPHDYRDGPHRKHDWHSGWVAEAVELLMRSHNSK